MVAQIAVEKMMEFVNLATGETTNQGWKPYTIISLELPFDRPKRFNFVFEVISELKATLIRQGVLEGTFRFGGDDASQMYWDGNIPRIITSTNKTRPKDYQTQSVPELPHHPKPDKKSN